MKIKFVLLTLLFLLTSPAISSGAQKIITDYTEDKIIGVQQPTASTISFDKDLASFTSTPSIGTNAVQVNSNKTVNLGGSNPNTCGVLWYGGTNPLAGNCVGGKCNFDTGFRAYFEFTSTTDTSADSTAQGHGFTFTVMNADATIGNTVNLRGGPPAGINMGELMCYAGSGNTSGSTSWGLRYPKMAIEFDTYRNAGTADVGCSSGRNETDNNNHTALVFWGATSAAYCANGSTVGNTYLRDSYDDNIQNAGTAGSTTVPRNSYNGDGTGGYYGRAKGATYNWMEDGLTHKVRIEVTRATTAATSGCAANTYAYNVKAWVDCELFNTPYTACSNNEYVYFEDVYNPYNTCTGTCTGVVCSNGTGTCYLPKINRTVCLSSTLHGNFSTMIFGFTEATGTGTITQNIQIKNFVLYFPSGYTWCSYEDPTPGAPGPFWCSFSGTRTVAYGANGFYNYMYNATSPVHCNNATFTDPIVGTLKNCYYK